MSFYLAKRPDINYRLPSNIAPYWYELEIRPFLADSNFTFSGRVRIHFTCLEETRSLRLHSKELNVTSFSLIDTNDTVSLLDEYDLDDDTDFLTFHANDTFKENSNYSVNIEFRGVILNRLYGFYRSSYLNKAENITYFLATTKFEPVYARRAL